MINAYAVKEEKGEFVPFQYDPGPLSGNEVEIDVLYCGLCHSDVSMIDNEWGMTEYPFVPGHEVAGRIAAVGEDVTEFSVGENVGLGWHAGYGDCSICNSGDVHLLNSAQPTIAGRHGGFADRVRAEAAAVVAIPDGIDLKVAGPLFCGGITVFNPLLEFDLKPTSKVAVIGIGGLGHLAIQFLNAWGCEVTAFSSSNEKREEALVLGAHHTLNSLKKAEIEAAAEKFDFIISTVNVKLDWNLYLSTLAPRGRLHFVGATLDPLDVDVFGLILKQRQISGSTVGSPESMATMLEFASLHGITPQIEMFRMDQVNEAIEKLKSGEVRYRIVLSNE